MPEPVVCAFGVLKRAAAKVRTPIRPLNVRNVLTIPTDCPALQLPDDM